AWTTRHRALLLSSACASAVATLCNPYGLSLLGFLSETLRPERAEIIEWQPVTRVPVVGFVLWTVPTIAAVFGIWKQRRRPALASMLVVVLLAIGSFRVIRLVGFYALAVAFLIPPWTEDEKVPSKPASWLRAALTCCALIVVASAAFGRALAMNAEWLPEREAALFIKEHDLRGRMLTWFDYGEFAIWHFSPAVRVSMDGRRETVYSAALRESHFRIYRNEPEAMEDVARLDPDYVWLPSRFDVVKR